MDQKTTPHRTGGMFSGITNQKPLVADPGKRVSAKVLRRIASDPPSYLGPVLDWYREERAKVRRELVHATHEFYKSIKRKKHRVMPTLVWSSLWDEPLEIGRHPIDRKDGEHGPRLLLRVRFRVSGLHAAEPGSARRWQWHWSGTWSSTEPPPKPFLQLGGLEGAAAVEYVDRFRTISSLNTVYQNLRPRFVAALLVLRDVSLDAAGSARRPEPEEDEPAAHHLDIAPGRQRSPTDLPDEEQDF